MSKPSQINRTTEFPHPFISAPVETPTFNSISYVTLNDHFTRALTRGIVMYYLTIYSGRPLPHKSTAGDARAYISAQLL